MNNPRDDNRTKLTIGLTLGVFFAVFIVSQDSQAAGPPPAKNEKKAEPCALASVPNAAPTRHRFTTLLAHFDAREHNAADFARVHSQEMGLNNDPAAEGRFGGGVAVTGESGYLLYSGLDNYSSRLGSVEFWARSQAKQSIWNDNQVHWFFVASPERGRFGTVAGTAPFFLALYKSAENKLVFRVVNRAIPRYALGVTLASNLGWSVEVPVAALALASWHHVVFSWDLRPPGRLWLLVDGQGFTIPLALPPNLPQPCPGLYLFFGGLSGLPGDKVRTSDCSLDELHIQAWPVHGDVAKLSIAPPRLFLSAEEEARLLQSEDLVRALADKLLALQFRGGWQDAYQWPTYEPSGWGEIGRGVNMWGSTSAEAGKFLFRAHRLLGDDRYLDAAIEAAEMFAKTQFPQGGWNYHYAYTRGRFTPNNDGAYIAQAMQSNQIRFLSWISHALGYETHRTALKRAGDFHLAIQSPKGWWGWETYPMTRATGPYGHPALNDAVTPQAMADLFIIWQATGDRRYLDAIFRGADWILQAQAGPPTYSWADQYQEKDGKYEFVWMRGFEPPAISMQAINAVAGILPQLYDLTGGVKYLEPLRKVLTWLDSVPKDQRGWLWYANRDYSAQENKGVAIRAGEPVVAYYNEMLPVTHPKAIKEYIPRLDAHYGTKFPFQAESIRTLLAQRQKGPVYPAWNGLKPRGEFAVNIPKAEVLQSLFRQNRYQANREALSAWRAGKKAAGLVGADRDYGWTFSPSSAIYMAERLLDDIEGARTALGDISLDAYPRYNRAALGDWVYLEPTRDYYALPKKSLTR